MDSRQIEHDTVGAIATLRLCGLPFMIPSSPLPDTVAPGPFCLECFDKEQLGATNSYGKDLCGLSCSCYLEKDLPCFLY